MAIAAVVLTLVDDPEGRARALRAVALQRGVSLGEDAGGPRLPAVLEADDAELEQRFYALREVPGVLEASLAAAWLEGGQAADEGSDRSNR
ncbi:MAG TPA: hypothetical protein VGK67_14960 [Myxococcales bacterium]|jgi:hypothetical protein